MKPLSLASPHLIIMVGIPGSGKTFFAEHFATTFNAPYINFDAISETVLGTKTNDSSEQTVINAISNYLLEQLLKTGQTIVYEGVTDSRTARQALTKVARDKGYEPLFVWVQTESVSAKARSIRPQKGKNVLSSGDYDAILRRFTPPNSAEKAIVISGKHTYASQLKIVLKRLVVARTSSSESVSPHVEGRRIAIR